LSPVPPVLSGADQARFFPHRSWLFSLRRDISHLSTSFDHQLLVISAFRSDIKREDYGDLVLSIQQSIVAVSQCGLCLNLALWRYYVANGTKRTQLTI
jgi:hypothetical protein